MKLVKVVTRPTWGEYFIEVAEAIAKRSTCPRASVGAVIVRENQITGHGYNGSPQGMPHCTEAGCLVYQDHCHRVVHAEVNAIVASCQTRHAMLFCTHLPCLECCKLIIQADLLTVYYRHEYVDALATHLGVTQHEFLTQGGLTVVRLPDKVQESHGTTTRKISPRHRTANG